MDAGAPISVVVVDEDPLSRGEVRRALLPAHDIVVVGTAVDATSAAALLSERPTDVVVSGETSPPGPIQSLAQPQPGAAGPALLVLVRQWSAEGAIALLRAGADGVLAKDSDPSVLPRVVRAAAAGEVVVPRSLVRTLVAELRSSAGPPRHGLHVGPSRRDLTERQWEVLDLLADGVTTEEIGERLGLRVETVRSHIKHLLLRLGVHTRAEAIERARFVRGREGLPSA